MKNLIKRIIILMSIAIFSSSVLVAAIWISIVDVGDLEINRRIFLESLILPLVIVIPFVVWISYLVLKRIVKPIKNVMKVALSITEGDFSIRADESLKGELGYLGKTINKLSIDLYRNISQLYVERNRLHQVLNSLEEGMIAVDENKIITHYNKVFLDMFSLTEEIIKDKCVDDIYILDEKLKELNQVIIKKYPIIKNNIHGDMTMRIVIAPVENEKNESVGAVVLFRDITESEKLEKMRKDYVANVSHELRTPLTSIRGLIEPLMDSIVTNEDDVKRYYEIIHRESLRLSRLVDDIMELSRLQTNDATILKSSIDVASILEMVYERYKLLDEEIILKYNPIPLPRAYSNYDRVEEILVILLDNAYKFTPKGGEIEIITKVRKDNIVILIKDTGIGINEEDLPFVFDRFYKVDKPRTKKGTGLGLSIAKEILNIMEEDISVKSTRGVGTIFEFTAHLEN